MNTRSAIAIAALGLSLTACSMIGARPSASADPATPAAPSPTPSATAPATRTLPPPTNSPQPSTPASSGLDGRQFVSVLVTASGKPLALVPGTRIRLGFSGAMISASAGCNSMGGEYHVQNGRLVVGSMATTDMGCQSNLMDQDQWLASFLGGHPAVALNGNDLVLTSDDAEVTFLDREAAEPDQPLTGITWGLTTILDGEVASSIPAGVTATLLFNDDGGFDFNDGCNSGGGQYEIDADHIHFSDVVSTKMACGGDRGDVSSSVVAVLNSDSVDFSIDHSTLALQAGDHGLHYDAAVDVTN